MGKLKANNSDRAQKEILDGVDAIGTIVDEDLGRLDSRMDQMTKSLDRIHAALSQLKIDQKSLENNQTDIMDTLKNMSDKLNMIEVRIAEGFQRKEFQFSDNE